MIVNVLKCSREYYKSKNGQSNKALVMILLFVISFFSNGTLALGADIEITSFYPRGEVGLFWDDEQVELSINGVNNDSSAQNFTVDFVITDFWNNQLGNTLSESFTNVAAGAAFSKTVNFGAISNNYGWFCVRAKVMQATTEITRKATGFCILKENVSVDDGFFSANANGAFDNKVIDGMKRVGVNSRGLGFKLGYHPDWANSLNSWLSANAIWTSDLDIVGYIWVDKYNYEATTSAETGMPTQYQTTCFNNVAAGVNPYPTTYFDEFEDFIAAVTSACGSRVTKWVISEEYNALPSLTPANFLQYEYERYIRQVQIAHTQFKLANSNCSVTGLTGTGTEIKPQLEEPAYWSIAQNELLPTTAPHGGMKDYIDIVGPDAYNDIAWLYTYDNIDFAGPEMHCLRDCLLATVELQDSLNNGLNKIEISEYGWSVPYHYEPDNEVTKRVAHLMARYITLVKSVPEVSSMSIWTMTSGAAWNVYYNQVSSTDANPIYDSGQWRVEYDETANPYYAPRPWVTVLATMNQMLGDASNPVEVLLNFGHYAWTFDKPAGGSIAVLWTSSLKTPESITLNLPAGCTRYDIMGNSQTLSAGNSQFTISECPFFISYSGSAADLRTAISSLYQPVSNEQALVLHLKLNETSGTTVEDSSTFENDGINISCTHVAGKFDNSLSLDNGADWIGVPSSQSIDVFEQISISFWFKSNSTMNQTVFIDKGTGLYIRTGNTGGATSLFVGHTQLSSHYTGNSDLPAFNDNNWHHVVFTWDGSCTKLYLDETCVQLVPGVTGIIDTSSMAYLHIGEGEWIGGSDFYGQIDDVRIYNKALKEEDFKGLVLHFKLDETSGTTVKDSSLFYNNGIMSGGTFVSGKFGNAVELDDNYDWIGSPNSESLSVFDQISISFWFKSNSSMNQMIFMDKGPKLYIRTANTGGATSLFVGHTQLSSYYTGQNNLPAFNDNNWHHIVFSWDGSSTQLYLDGTCVQSVSGVSGTIDTSNVSYLHIGEGGWTGTNDFAGQIDDVRIYNRGITAKEVNLLYESTE